MDNLRLKTGERALVIVAHPDDETIWLGGTILKHPRVRWTIFSLCRASDPDRAPKFWRVCKFFGAKGIMTNLEDEGKLGVKIAVPISKKLILTNLLNKKFDYIFTHGANGEYGHPRHKSIHRAVVELVYTGQLTAKQLLCFNYQLTREHKLSVKDDSDVITKLTSAEFKQKKKIMTELYGFAPDGIDANYCTKTEAFIKK